MQTGGRSWPLELVVCPALFLWFVTHTQAVLCEKKKYDFLSLLIFHYGCIIDEIPTCQMSLTYL